MTSLNNPKTRHRHRYFSYTNSSANANTSHKCTKNTAQ